MENEQKPTEGSTTEGESLEGTAAYQPTSTTPDSGLDSNKDVKKKKESGVFGRFSVYLLMFALVILLAMMVVVGTYLRSHSKTNH